ncbi:sensor histidine kinase [Spirosoma linguale]|uniref:Signal transduction histidine kinase, LytS n=1 Tax=Spirosoma linguale (strain ATCC 33905 / DSM 74 / LMG 10896 / Claus 1) TaxID=504472 RepID=D2QED1_SPILD|nr:signal transduction histidine kinase, LytS [Spirosoma linguale DSM 74]
MRISSSLRAPLLLIGCLIALLGYWGWLLYRLLGPQLTQELPDLGSLASYLLGLFVLLIVIWLLAYLSYRFTFQRWMHQPEKRLYYWCWLCFLAWLLFEVLQWRTDQEPAFVDENILVTLLLTGLVILYGFVADSLQSKRQQQRLIQQKTEAELTALKAQINPHFLFNALNTIYNEAQQSENQSVADLIEQLASIMRFTLQESSRSLISVEQEFKFLEKYLALQRARLPKLNNLHVHTHLDWDGQPAQLPPLLLIPFIENMFQYGVSLEHPATLELDVRVENRQLDLRVFNTLGVAAISKNGSGTGIKNARQRLALLYPDRHELRVEQSTQFFVVSLRIDL